MQCSKLGIVPGLSKSRSQFSKVFRMKTMTSRHKLEHFPFSRYLVAKRKEENQHSRFKYIYFSFSLIISQTPRPK